ncbi:hypothetical protein B0H15DRAFT_931723 [Mycena belliarum]|uniref:F-box domain-containing protein n=1 Tax=Mycena belliarum TaxID=1033014 RepID=A0AAD6U4Z6_9AGAR|nr:hypothetical protein B0H15DRAFT_931723 [Mycena belliae]
MPLLLDLPNELILLIFLPLLANNADSLDALCLVHRRLLAIARPLTWRKLILDGSFGGPGSEEAPREARFLEFVSDETRAAAVRCLVLRGEVHPRGLALLSKLPSIMHLEILGEWMDPSDWYDVFMMIHGLVGTFPILESLYLSNCMMEDGDFDEFKDELQVDDHELDRNTYDPGDEVLSHSLRRILCENVDPAMRKLWLSTPNLEVVEMHVCTPHPLNSYRQVGIHRMLLRDPNFCEKVKRMNVEYCLVTEEEMDEELDDDDDELRVDENMDADNITNFFKWRAHTLPSLQDLVLEIPFQLNHLQEIIPAIPQVCPILKRLKFQMSPSGYKEFLEKVQTAKMGDRFKLGGAELPCLEELRLPFTGLHHDLMAALPGLLLNAPNLIHLYLGNPRVLDAEKPSDSALLQCANTYAAAIPSLKSVSWDRLAAVKIKRDSASAQCEMAVFEAPFWEKQQGLAGWY